MAKELFAVIEKERVVIVSLYEESSASVEARLLDLQQNIYPDLTVVRITDMKPMPGVRWGYKNKIFTPPEPEPEPVDPLQAAKELAATINTATLTKDSDKALLAIMYALNIIKEGA